MDSPTIASPIFIDIVVHFDPNFSFVFLHSIRGFCRPTPIHLRIAIAVAIVNKLAAGYLSASPSELAKLILEFVPIGVLAIGWPDLPAAAVRLSRRCAGFTDA